MTDVLAIIHSMYCEELTEQLWAGLESSIKTDGFSFAEILYIDQMGIDKVGIDEVGS